MGCHLPMQLIIKKNRVTGSLCLTKPSQECRELYCHYPHEFLIFTAIKVEDIFFLRSLMSNEFPICSSLAKLNLHLHNLLRKNICIVFSIFYSVQAYFKGFVSWFIFQAVSVQHFYWTQTLQIFSVFTLLGTEEPNHCVVKDKDLNTRIIIGKEPSQSPVQKAEKFSLKMFPNVLEWKCKLFS